MSGSDFGSNDGMTNDQAKKKVIEKVTLKPADKTQPNETPGKDRVFALVVTAAYAVLLLICILRHEMWRDETSVWMMSKHINSFADLVRVVDEEVNPFLWYLLLAITSKISPFPVAMQILHTVIASVGAYIFLRFAPLSRLQKGLYVFGFFPFYEHGVISRAYALGMVFGFAVCALFPQRNQKLWVIAILLFLMGSSTPLGLLLSLALALTIGFTWVWDRFTEGKWPVSVWKMIGFVLVTVIGAKFSAVQIQMKGAAGVTSVKALGGNIEYSGVELAKLISRVYLYDFGSQPYLHTAIISLLLVVISVALFIRKPPALFLYLCANAMMFVAIYTTQIGYPWHIGHFFYIFVMALFLGGYYTPQTRQLKNRKKPNQVFYKFSYYFVVALFAFQFFVATIAASIDFTGPYSCGKETAEYIQSRGLQNMTIAGDMKYCLQTVINYLNRPAWFIANGDDGVYGWWWDVYSPTVNLRAAEYKYEYVRRLRLIAQKSSNGVLLVLSYPLPPEFAKYIGADLLKSFQGEVGSFIQGDPVVAENYWVYMLKPASNSEHRPMSLCHDLGLWNDVFYSWIE